MVNAKKIIFVVLTFCLFFCADSTVFEANESTLSTKVSQSFVITGGISKDFESTFDSQRTITGVAQSGSEITICVSLKGEDDIYFERANYIVNVGAANLFSKTIELYVGENQVSFYVDNESFEPIVQQFIVKRKSSGIKQLLEQNIVMPGDLFTVSYLQQ